MNRQGDAIRGLEPCGSIFRAGDDLRQAVMIAQIDEQQPAMVALAMHPARQADALSDVLAAKLAAMKRARGPQSD